MVTTTLEKLVRIITPSFFPSLIGESIKPMKLKLFRIYRSISARLIVENFQLISFNSRRNFFILVHPKRFSFDNVEQNWSSTRSSPIWPETQKTVSLFD